MSRRCGKGASILGRLVVHKQGVPHSAIPHTLGLVRAADAIDALLAQISDELTDGFLPQRRVLLTALNFSSTFRQRIEDYLAETVYPLNRWDQTGGAISAAIMQLGQIEDALVDLRRAVSWSSRFAGFNWWLQQRQNELDIGSYIVIAGPGSARSFHIETESSLAKCIELANSILAIPGDELGKIRSIRILTVAQNDGAAPKWHPITLGHEVAHLYFDRNWVMKWMAGIDESEYPASQAVEKAKVELAFDPGSKSQSPTCEAWFTQLVAWLVETACDAVLDFYYGEPGVKCLRTYLSAHSDGSDGLEHPAPGLRIKALTSRSIDELAEFQTPKHGNSIQHNRVNSYCQLAGRCIAAVREILEPKLPNRGYRDGVIQRVADATKVKSPPLAADWDSEVILSNPSVIESGLVGALWDQLTSPPFTDAGEVDWADIGLAEMRTDHAVDYLQFAHRFECGYAKIEPARGERDKLRPSNVLFVSDRGVAHHPETAGSASADVRLGRHFVVFRRNQISTLNSIDASNATRQIQETVEIGWGETFVLHPHEMVLAVTLESLVMAASCTAQVLSRSSLGRMGLLSATAVQVQPGFRGCLTLELVNLASVPLMLNPGQRIAQIVPSKKCGDENEDYAGKYQDQDWRPKFSSVVSDWEMPILQSLSESS